MRYYTIITEQKFRLGGNLMRTKKQSTFLDIESFIVEYTDQYGHSPSIDEISKGIGVPKTTTHSYLSEMRKNGAITYSGCRNITLTKEKTQTVKVPVLGRIACGIPKFAEENIEEYVKLPVSLFGSGEYFILRAYGDSMIEAGIADGDLVLIRQQNTADSGQIVVALMEDEATLKRFYPEPKKHRIRLHPENSKMEDIFVEDCVIQGVAVKMLKDLE